MTALPSSKMPILATALLLAGLAFALASPPKAPESSKNPWSESRFQLLQVLSIQETHDTTARPNDPLVALGHTLFFDTDLNPESGLGCVSCHLPNKAFSDGLSHPKDNPQRRNAPGLIGASQNRWQFWDGRKDSSWSQALAPLFAAHEIALSPQDLLNKVAASIRYQRLFSDAFGDLPTPMPEANSAEGMKVQAQIGLAIESYLNELKHQPSPFDHYVTALSNNDNAEANRWLSNTQQSGLAIFLRSNCISCHRGAAFTDGQFHNIGTGGTDRGRAQGKIKWQADPFNCSGEVAAAIGRPCDINAIGEAEIPKLLDGAFKTPSLRELSHTAPYMHDGRFESLEEVIEHYRNPPKSEHGLAAIQPISDEEAMHLAEFLKALSGPIDDDAWYNKSPTPAH